MDQNTPRLLFPLIPSLFPLSTLPDPPRATNTSVERRATWAHPPRAPPAASARSPAAWAWPPRARRLPPPARGGSRRAAMGGRLGGERGRGRREAALSRPPRGSAPLLAGHREPGRRYCARPPAAARRARARASPPSAPRGHLAGAPGRKVGSREGGRRRWRVPSHGPVASLQARRPASVVPRPPWPPPRLQGPPGRRAAGGAAAAFSGLG